MSASAAHDIAIAAPMSLIYAVTTVIMLMFDIEAIAWLAAAAALAVPFLLGLYVFAERPLSVRIMLALWAPVGQWGLLFALWYFVWRNAARLSPWVLGFATVGPLVILLAASALFGGRPSSSSGRVGLGVSWLIALAETAAAMPLAEWLAESAGVDTLAAVVVLFAPAAALGTWAGLAAASAMPVPDPDFETAGDGS